MSDVELPPLPEPVAWMVENDFEQFTTMDDPTDVYPGYDYLPLYTADQLRAAVEAALEAAAKVCEDKHAKRVEREAQYWLPTTDEAKMPELTCAEAIRAMKSPISDSAV